MSIQSWNQQAIENQRVGKAMWVWNLNKFLTKTKVTNDIGTGDRFGIAGRRPLRFRHNFRGEESIYDGWMHP